MQTIILKHKYQIDLIKRAASIVHSTHNEIRKHIKVGVTTNELDAIAAAYIRSQDATPAFLDYRGYPFSICTSINDEVIHGFPSERKLEEGDLLSVDVGARYEGYCGDAAFSTEVGRETGRVTNLIQANYGALIEGIRQARHGKKVGDISNAIQSFVEGSGYGIVKNYCGHGIGKELHEDPMIPNYGYANRGFKLKAGMVICIEPMITEGRTEVITDWNGWTVRTVDGLLASHYEHTVLITDGTPVILSN
jgi:methionyl aminopeptidase